MTMLTGAVLCAFCAGTQAEDITITSNTSWPEGEYTYDAVVVTNGATLTLQGATTITADMLTVEAGSAISADGAGYGPEQGPGAGQHPYAGAGHGGAGGSAGSALGGVTYGHATAPVAMGSGGGSNSDVYQGGAGGGAIHLIVTGDLDVNGLLSANGAGGPYGGGGAGGSIHIEAGTLSGSGTIRANGGAGSVSDGLGWGGGGGGGRIALRYALNTFTGSAEAHGGPGYRADSGQEGTVGFFDISDPANPDFKAGHAWRFQVNDLPLAFHDVLLRDSQCSVEDGARVTAANLFTIDRSAPDRSSTLGVYTDKGGIDITANALTIGEGCLVTANQKGHPGGEGPGAGAVQSGAGHGGRGGDLGSSMGGGTYGLPQAPTTLGSGGGPDDRYLHPSYAGAGGGTVRLRVSGEVQIDGTISANAADGIWYGGGSGGSIYISCDTVSGGGAMTANGGKGSVGDAYGYAGGGGGGRIATHYVTNDFTGTAAAAGGAGCRAENGEDGTVTWLRQLTIAVGQRYELGTDAFVNNVFQLDWPGGSEELLLLRLTPIDGEGVWSLLGRFGGPPSDGLHDWQGVGPTVADPPTYDMLVPVKAAGAYYFTVRLDDWAKQPARFELACLVAPEHYLTNVNLGSGGNSGSVTVRVWGRGFGDGVALQLRTHAGAVLRSFGPALWDSTGMTVSLDLTGLNPQTVDVAIVWPDSHEEVIHNAFQITGAPPGELRAEIELPSQVRTNRVVTLWLVYENVGSSDLPAPMLRVISDQDLAMRLSNAGAFHRSPISLLAVSDTPPVDVLPPGKRVRVPVYFIPEGPGHTFLSFHVEQELGGAVAVDWEGMAPYIRPAGLSDDAWAIILGRLESQLGTTDDAYLARLRHDAQYLASLGRRAYDISLMYGLEFNEATAATGVGGPLWVERDAQSRAARPPMTFLRFAAGSIPGRFAQGAFGRGWSHEYEWRLVFPDVETVVAVGPAGIQRRFVVAPTGKWVADGGDLGVFENAEDGYHLTDKGVMTRVFDLDGRLIHIYDPDGNAITLAYTGGLLTSIEHACGDTFTLGYTSGRVTTLTDAAGHTTSYAYGGDTLSTATTSAGAVTAYAYHTSPGPIRDRSGDVARWDASLLHVRLERTPGQPFVGRRGRAVPLHVSVARNRRRRERRSRGHAGVL